MPLFSFKKRDTITRDLLFQFFCYFLGYPERLDLKPVGARDPPPHFQRKQEYL